MLEFNKNVQATCNAIEEVSVVPGACCCCCSCCCCVSITINNGSSSSSATLSGTPTPAS